MASKILSLNGRLLKAASSSLLFSSCSRPIRPLSLISSNANKRNVAYLGQRRLYSASSSTKEAEILTSTAKSSATPPPDSNDKKPPNRSKFASSSYRKFLLTFASGVVAYFSLSYYLDYKQSSKKAQALLGVIDHSSPYLPGRVKPSKSVSHGLAANPGNVKITLYQYASCPFCCKVRAYLDYYGYNYDIVEVNSITRKQLSWTGYKKVPVVVVADPAEKDTDDELVQFNDSSLIISALETHRLDPTLSMKKIKSFYEPLLAMDNAMSNTSLVNEFNNKYFVMVPSNIQANVNEIKYERQWRSWTDSQFVHAISPNIYRTLGESIEAFKWFDEFGEWKSNFNSVERGVIIYLGALVMYFVGMKLKSKHGLKDNVRESLFDLSSEWTSGLSKAKPFCGGVQPNLADLALYGILNSFVGCKAFTELSAANADLKAWFEACHDHVINSKGKQLLQKTTSKKISISSSTASSLSPSSDSKKKKYFYFF